MTNSTTSVRTASGLFFDFADPNPDHITVEDIALSLSRNPRFNGHMQCFYSVAQHAVSVSSLVAQRCMADGLSRYETALYAFAALHHDDSEALMSDIPTPLKRLLPDYTKMELTVQSCLNKKFGLSELAHQDERIKQADMTMLFLERDAMIDDKVRWSIEDLHPGYCMTDLFTDFEPWPMEQAYETYLLVHNSLAQAVASAKDAVAEMYRQ
jgi:uncharacterized protein